MKNNIMLDRLEKANDIKNFAEDELPVLAAEIREFLLDALSEKGGHPASNFGAVELTIALHRIFSLPTDKIIWDVGHQAYTHKILTGRKDDFSTLREYGGLSGFPKRSESDCDVFDTGHASTSISAGLGMVKARDLKGDDYKVISVIGDGSMTGGLAFEAMNNAGTLKTNFIIVLNDNKMSISENVGGLAKQLARLRTSKGYTGLKQNVQNSLEKIPLYGEKIVRRIRRTKSGLKQLVIPGMLFEEMGLLYLGPVDGHDIKAMEDVFRSAAKYKGPVLVHVITKKGKGYLPAERHPARFHGTDAFDRETGLPLSKKKPAYSDIFSTVMAKLGDEDERICAVTAAMMDGTGLKRFRNKYPERFFDVGIAEEHAVTFAAGLASSGMHPVVAVYSSFLQRAFDQMMLDVCMQSLPVTFAIDRAGVIGRDGMTHQGTFDLSYLSMMPNMTVLAPKNKWEFSDMMKYAVSRQLPTAVRYPRGDAYDGLKKFRAPIEEGKAEVVYEEGEILLFAAGSMVRVAEKARELLSGEGIKCALTNARFIKPIDSDYLREATKKYSMIVTLEENVRTGGFGERTLDLLTGMGYDGQVLIVALPDEFIPQGGADKILDIYGLSAEKIKGRIMEALHGKKKA